MYFLMKLALKPGGCARCVVTHVRPPENEDAEAEPLLIETLEDKTVLETDGPPDRERGWVIPANPRPGDHIRFELVEVEPIGEQGAGYRWEVSFCEAMGPAKMEDPRIFEVSVPAQTHADISECPGADVKAIHAIKDGERSFRLAA